MANPQQPPTIVQAAAFVKDYVPPEYLIDGIIQRGRLYSTTAITGHGKTAVWLTLSAHIVTGKELDGRHVTKGRVIYFSAENPDDARGRLMLLADRMEINLNAVQLFFIAGSFNLADWHDHIQQEAAKLGLVDLIIIDTGPAFFVACGLVDENDNAAQLGFALKLRGLTGIDGAPAVVVLTHPTKHADKDNLIPRGGGAMLNEVDGNLTLWAEGDRSTTVLSSQGKFRGADFEPISFALKPGTCNDLMDKAGRHIPSVWARLIDEEQVGAAVSRQRQDEDDVLFAMDNYPKAGMSFWAQQLGWEWSSGKPAKGRVERAIHRLKNDRLVALRRGRWTITEIGKKEVKRVVDEERSGLRIVPSGPSESG